MHTVSLDPYRTKGVRIFLGRGRGQAVARAIKEKYGTDISLTVPSDVYLIDRGFRIGFNKVLPNVDIPDTHSS